MVLRSNFYQALVCCHTVMGPKVNYPTSNQVLKLWLNFHLKDELISPTVLNWFYLTKLEFIFVPKTVNTSLYYLVIREDDRQFSLYSFNF